MLVLRVSCKRIEKKKKVEIPYRHISHTHDAFRTPIRVDSLCLCFFFFRAHVCTNSILYTTYCTTTNTHLTHVVTHLGYQLGLIHSIFLEHMFMLIPSRYTTYYTVFYRTSFSSGVFFYFFLIVYFQVSVNNWSIFDINRLLFPSQPFSWREMKAAGAAGYSQESSYALRLLPVPQMWTFLLCVPFCLLLPLLALLYFLFYCFIVLLILFRNFKVFSCWQHFQQ